MGGGDEGIARWLWNKCKNVSVFAKYSNFVVCLASGTLDSHAFLHCISQDLLFLHAFIAPLELAEDCADDEEDRGGIRALRKRVKRMLKFYDARVREWGFELPEERASSSATVRYAEFLLATASGKIEGEKVPVNIATPFERTKVAAYTLAAMAPCMRLYASISKEIHGLLDTDENSHIYKKWADYYCSQDFEAHALRFEDMLDKLSISLTGEELEVVERLYLQAIKLEVEFFLTQPVGQQSVLPFSLLQDPADSLLSIFCDFDMTCSAVDTSDILAEIAITSAQKVDTHGPDSQLTRMSLADLRRTWSTLAVQYVGEHDRCIGSIIPSKTEMFNYEGVCKALENLADFEKRANSKLSESEALKGLSLEDIHRAGKHLAFQDGCKEFFQKIINNEKPKSNIHVISYCWCGDLISSAFSSWDPKVLDVLKVHSNELAYEGSVSTGEIVRMVESPTEKLQVFSNILKDRGTNGLQLTVYIGGSVGDLLCLLKADIGIVIGSSPSLRKLGGHFGISFVPLFSGVIEKQKELTDGGSHNWKGLQGILYTVSSWAEIQAFIMGL